MNQIHPTAHPLEGPLAAKVDHNGPKGRTRKTQGEVRTLGNLIFSLIQFMFAFGAFHFMVTTANFSSITSFRYFAVVTGVHMIWSFSLTVLNTYALLANHSFKGYIVWFVVGDTITSSLTFTAASAAWAIVSLSNGMYNCSTNQCEKTIIASAMALRCCCAALPSVCSVYGRLHRCEVLALK